MIILSISGFAHLETSVNVWSKDGLRCMNGRILVEMLITGYGYKEAGQYFGELMEDVLSEIGVSPCASDICLD